MDKKRMLQDGFKKKQVAVVIEWDPSGKIPMVIVDSLEHAKEYKELGEQVRLYTLYYKDDKEDSHDA